MFFVIAFFIGFIHAIASMMCSLAVDQEGFQRAAKILSYPAPFAKGFIKSVRAPLDGILSVILSSGVWGAVIAAMAIYLLRRRISRADAMISNAGDKPL
jgi:hypothetical protein